MVLLQKLNIKRRKFCRYDKRPKVKWLNAVISVSIYVVKSLIYPFFWLCRILGGLTLYKGQSHKQTNRHADKQMDKQTNRPTDQ